jgi:hypothetical protein
MVFQKWGIVLVPTLHHVTSRATNFLDYERPSGFLKQLAHSVSG